MQRFVFASNGGACVLGDGTVFRKGPCQTSPGWEGTMVTPEVHLLQRFGSYLEAGLSRAPGNEPSQRVLS